MTKRTRALMPVPTPPDLLVVRCPSYHHLPCYVMSVSRKTLTIRAKNPLREQAARLTACGGAS